MKKIFLCLFCVAIIQSALGQAGSSVNVGMNKVKLEFTLDANGRPTYSVFYGDKPVVKPSHLGIKLLNDGIFDDRLTLIATDKKSVDETWEPVWGEVSKIRNHYEQVTFHLNSKPGKNAYWILFSGFLRMG